ncbi:RRM domain-containing protein [Entamoeba marina]
MDATTIFIAFQQPPRQTVTSDDIYDSLQHFGEIARIIRTLNSTNPQFLIEFTDRSSCEKTLSYLNNQPIPNIGCRVRAEYGKDAHLTIHKESPQARDYTRTPRGPPVGSNTKVLLVHELPSRFNDSTPDHIHSLFSVYGPIEKVNLLTEKNAAMVQFSTVNDACTAYTQLNNVMFFNHRLSLKHSRHDSIAAPVSIRCKEYQPTQHPQSTSPTPYVAFLNLHPIVSCAPKIDVAICHYFDHYYSPRPADVVFTSQDSGVFLFRSVEDAVIAVSLLNNKNEQGIPLTLSFVRNPPQLNANPPPVQQYSYPRQPTQRPTYPPSYPNEPQPPPSNTQGNFHPEQYNYQRPYGDNYEYAPKWN